MKKVKLMVIGAGGRGNKYATLAAKISDRVEIVAVAEPRDFHRAKFAKENSIPPENMFKSWTEAANTAKLADAVAICTQDKMHVEPAIAFAEKGYDILLEKPMAPDAEGCRRIIEATEKNNVILAVCHVLRYTKYTQTLKRLVDDGKIGDIISIQHLEPIGYWHFAHSYVRGNWRREEESSSALLAKSCHDLDWIRYIMNQKCEKISSFGSLKFFKPENRPDGATKRCMDCPVENSCSYSAKRFYFDRLNTKQLGWPLDVVDPEMTKETLTQALNEGLYGRCVFACDNDVVDNQVVNMEFEGGATASFSMMACSEYTSRKTTIFGTQGELRGDSSKIEIFDYLTNKTSVIDTEAGDTGFAGGHGGGDGNVLSHFIDAVATNDRSTILTGPQVSLESHLMVFTAEQSRKNDCIVLLRDFNPSCFAEGKK